MTFAPAGARGAVPRRSERTAAEAEAAQTAATSTAAMDASRRRIDAAPYECRRRIASETAGQVCMRTLRTGRREGFAALARPTGERSGHGAAAVASGVDRGQR